MMGNPDVGSLAQMLGGAPPAASPGGGDSESPADQDALAHVKAALRELDQAASKEPDAVERASLAKVIATLHQWLANDQQSAEAALGGGPATRALRKMSTGA